MITCSHTESNSRSDARACAMSPVSFAIDDSMRRSRSPSGSGSSGIAEFPRGDVAVHRWTGRGWAASPAPKGSTDCGSPRAGVTL